MARLGLEAGKGDVGGVQERLAAGDDVNFADGSDMRTALHEASCFGHPEVVELLLSLGADINKRSATGYTPLHLAAWNGQTVTVQVLLQRGADTRLQNNKGNTPLHLAARFNHLEVVGLIMSNVEPAEVDAPNVDGDTPLHMAARQGQAGLQLLDLGATPGLANGEGRTASDVAGSDGMRELITRYGSTMAPRESAEDTVEIII